MTALTVGAALIALIYTGVSGMAYAGKAGIVIAQPPTYLPPFPVSGSHSTLSAYVNQQIALLQSQSVSDQAAAIVNQKIANAHVTGPQIHQALSVKPQSAASAGTNPTTEVVVSMPTPELAAASANAVIASYTQHQHTQVRQQAGESIDALNKQITAVTNELNGLPVSSTGGGVAKKGTTTPTTHVRPPTTTTVPHHQTTTTHPHTTTTHAGTTTTKGGTTSSARAAALHLQLMSLDITSTTTITTIPTTTATTTTTIPSSSTGTSSSSTAAQRAVLLSTLINLTRSKTQVSVDEQADLTNQPTIFPATIPGASSNNDLLRNTVIGALVGLLLGVIIAYALAANRRQFERAEEPEGIYGIPLVAVVPAFPPTPWLPTGLPILTMPLEEPAESFRVIATALRAFRGLDDSILIAFSAAAARSGTTAMVANTGLALAEMGERVLVIDGDPIVRGLTRSLTDTDQDSSLTTLRMGFSEVVGGRPLIQTTVAADANSNLSVLTSGQDPQLAVHRWSPQAIRLALGDAKTHFDIILMDVPPVGSSSYGMDLASSSDHLMMVIPYLDAVAVHEVLPDRLGLAGTHLLGYIFNGPPSRNHYSPYVPILHGATGPEGRRPVPIPAERPELVASSGRPAPPPSAPASDDLPPHDITAVVPAVGAHDPITEEVDAVSDDAET